MPRVAFLDCRAGVAGDMLLAALIDAGAPKDELEQGLQSIKALAGEWRIETRRVVRSKGHIAANHVKVHSKYNHKEVQINGDGEAAKEGQVKEEHHHHKDDHDHDHESHHHHHHHNDEEECQKKDGNGGGGEHEHKHHEPHRDLATIRSMLLNAEGLPSAVRGTSLKVFTALAEAEAATHGVNVDEIHFHEVGAVDSIIDTVGVVYALHLLGVDQIYSSPLPFGEGMTGMTAHGILPVPTPATLRLMLGIPTIPGPPGAKGELVTPTGASLIKVLAKGHFGQPPPFVPDVLGVGAGTKDFPDHANIVRVVIGHLNADPVPRVPSPSRPTSSTRSAEEILQTRGSRSGSIASTSSTRSPHRNHRHHGLPIQDAVPTQPLANPISTSSITSPDTNGSGFGSHMGGDWEERRLCELEANLDDMTPETASFALERLLEEPGCLDVWYTPAVMKKGRPGLTLHLLCEPSAAPAILRRMFLETPTLGVRAHIVERLALQRDFVIVPTRYGDVRAKVARMDGVVINVKPEYEDCKGAAMALGLPLRAVVDEATRVARGNLDRHSPTPPPSAAVEEEAEDVAAEKGEGEGREAATTTA